MRQRYHIPATFCAVRPRFVHLYMNKMKSSIKDDIPGADPVAILQKSHYIYNRN